MTFSYIKLSSKETIIADAYNCKELLSYLEGTPEATILKNSVLLDMDRTILCLDPVEIIIKAETSLAKYMPFSEDFIIPVSIDQIISITKPNKIILNAYNEYVNEYKQKLELRAKLKKDIGSHYDEDCVNILNDLDPKKSTKH